MIKNATYADWIAVDWGTSHLRVWAMCADGTIRAEARSEDGMGRLAPDEFEPALLRLIEPWLGAAAMPIMACGMVGARQGWVEAPYSAVPCKPAEATPTRVETRDKRLSLHIMPGVCQASPPDVMRGEETQVAGALAVQPGFDGVICLPGTHTKWVHVSAGEIVSFQTCMTGELFALLSSQSVLRHGVGGKDLDAEAFGEAVSLTLSRPEKLAQLLFAIRAEGLLQGLTPARARGRLSGLLIGAELAATRPYWLGQPVVVAGSAAVVPLYQQALETQGVPVQPRDADALTLAGLRHAYTLISESKA